MWTQILTALLVGLLTAFAFQLLLTSLGVAIGITALSFRFVALAEAKSDSVEPQLGETDSEGNLDELSPNTVDSAIATDGSTSRIGTFAGLSILITINTVLFGACFLATQFSQVSRPISGAIVGIVIWSAYFLILTWVSSTAVSTLIGSVLSMATGGFRRLVTIIKDAFKGQADDPLTQEQTIAMIRQEIQQVFNPATLDQIINQSIDQSLNRNSALVQAQPNPMAIGAFQQTHNLTDRLKASSELNPEVVEQVAEQLQHLIHQLIHQPIEQPIVDQRIASLQSDLPTQSAEETTTQLWQKFISYLRYTSPKRLTSERIQRQLETLLKEVQENSVPPTRLLKFDRSELEDLLKRRKGLDKKQRKQILQQVEATWNQAVEQFEAAQFEASDSEELESESSDSLPVVPYLTEAVQQFRDKLPEGKLDLELIRNNLPEWITASSVTAGALQQLKQIDWETLPDRLPLQNLNAFDDTQIQHIATEVRSAAQELMNVPQQWAEEHLTPQAEALKQQMMQQIDTLQQTLQQRVDTLKIQTQQRLEDTRKSAVTAAWWLFATASTAAVSAASAGALAAHLL